jgi:D-isomer specific 2-hydroxyacid dehydrogenase, NAD binding domain
VRRVWLPEGARRGAVGDLPADLDVRAWGEGPEEVAFVVLAPPARGAVVDLLPRMARLEVVQLLNAGVDWVPATDETRGLVDAAFLDRMKEGALLVNGARGSLVDTDALVAAARAGRVRAALDATDPEPLPDGHPLWSTPGVLVTPHVAGSSAHWQDRAYALVGHQLRRWAAGEPLLNVRDAGY